MESCLEVPIEMWKARLANFTQSASQAALRLFGSFLVSRYGLKARVCNAGQDGINGPFELPGNWEQTTSERLKSIEIIFTQHTDM